MVNCIIMVHLQKDANFIKTALKKTENGTQRFLHRFFLNWKLNQLILYWKKNLMDEFVQETMILFGHEEQVIWHR